MPVSTVLMVQYGAEGVPDMADTSTNTPPPTRQQILDAAEAAVLAKGFSGTSIDELIAAVGISKSGFFYHFRDKTQLAKALLLRYVEEDNRIFADIFSRADELSEDPLHSFLIGLKMLAEVFADLPNGHPGCMVASICYHEQLFDREVRQINAEAVLGWRIRFRERLERVAQQYPPRLDIDLDDLADMLSAVADGGIILSKATGDKSSLPRQMLLYRDFVRLIFQPGS
jgi:TetR/AcrR family transcriptional regulator, transcriptional repressor for nem operon